MKIKLLLTYFCVFLLVFFLIKWLLTLTVFVSAILCTSLVISFVLPVFFKKTSCNYDVMNAVDFKVCIMIPAKNEQKVIGRTLDTIMNLNYDNYRVIVINDGSTDDTGKIVENYVKTSDKVQQVNIPVDSPYHGKAFALNEAYKLFNEDILLILDADAIIEPDYLQNVLKPFRDPKVMAVQSGIKAYDYHKTFISKLVGYDLEFTNIVMKNYLPFRSFGMGILLRNEILKRLFPMEINSISEDEQTSIYIHKNKCKGCYVFDDFVYESPVYTLKVLYNQRKRWFLGSFKELFSKHFFLFVIQTITFFLITGLLISVFLFPLTPPAFLFYSFAFSFFFVAFLERKKFGFRSPGKIAFYTILSYIFNLFLYDISFVKLFLYHDKNIRWYKTPR